MVASKASKGEKTLLKYVKSAYEKNGKITSVPIKATGEITEDGMVVNQEIGRAGPDNEKLEMVSQKSKGRPGP